MLYAVTKNSDAAPTHWTQSTLWNQRILFIVIWNDRIRRLGYYWCNCIVCLDHHRYTALSFVLNIIGLQEYCHCDKMLTPKSASLFFTGRTTNDKCYQQAGSDGRTLLTTYSPTVVFITVIFSSIVLSCSVSCKFCVFFLFLFKGSSKCGFFPPCCPVQVLSCALFASFIWTNKDDDDDTAWRENCK